MNLIHILHNIYDSNLVINVKHLNSIKKNPQPFKYIYWLRFVLVNSPYEIWVLFKTRFLEKITVWIRLCVFWIHEVIFLSNIFMIVSKLSGTYTTILFSICFYLGDSLLTNPFLFWDFFPNFKKGSCKIKVWIRK